jgi:hypothetical protein
MVADPPLTRANRMLTFGGVTAGADCRTCWRNDAEAAGRGRSASQARPMSRVQSASVMCRWDGGASVLAGVDGGVRGGGSSATPSPAATRARSVSTSSPSNAARLGVVCLAFAIGAAAGGWSTPRLGNPSLWIVAGPLMLGLVMLRGRAYASAAPPYCRRTLSAVPHRPAALPDHGPRHGRRCPCRGPTRITRSAR